MWAPDSQIPMEEGQKIQNWNLWLNTEFEVDYYVDVYKAYFASIQRLSKDTFEVTSKLSRNHAVLRVTPRGLHVLEYTRVDENSPVVEVGEFWESIDQLVFQMDPDMTPSLLIERLNEVQQDEDPNGP